MMDYEIYKATEGRKTYLVFPYRQILTYKNNGLGFCKDKTANQIFEQAKKYFKVSESKLKYRLAFVKGDDLWFDYKPRGAQDVLVFYTCTKGGGWWLYD